MTRDEYERHKRRIEEQCRAGIELLESACQAQIRALDLVWMLQGQGEGIAAGSWRETFTSPPAVLEPPPAAARSKGRKGPEFEADLHQSFWRLPERFTRGDVCEVLGYEPDRGALYRKLQSMVTEGAVHIESAGEGQRATVYRKIEKADSPAQA